MFFAPSFLLLPPFLPIFSTCSLPRIRSIALFLYRTWPIPWPYINIIHSVPREKILPSCVCYPYKCPPFHSPINFFPIWTLFPSNSYRIHIHTPLILWYIQPLCSLALVTLYGLLSSSVLFWRYPSPSCLFLFLKECLYYDSWGMLLSGFIICSALLMMSIARMLTKQDIRISLNWLISSKQQRFGTWS